MRGLPERVGPFLFGFPGIEETIGKFWGGDATGVGAAKPGVAITGDPFVDGVSEEGGEWSGQDC